MRALFLLLLATATASGIPPQSPLPPQAPARPYCLCWHAGEECTCGVCTCPGGRIVRVSNYGNKVEFKRDASGKWMPQGEGWHWHEEGKFWHKHSVPVDPALPHSTIPTWNYAPVFFSGGRGGGGC